MKIFWFVLQKLVKNGNFDNVINENCPIGNTKICKNENFDYVINDQTPPPPLADYVICEDPFSNVFIILYLNYFFSLQLLSTLVFP